MHHAEVRMVVTSGAIFLSTDKHSTNWFVNWRRLGIGLMWFISPQFSFRETFNPFSWHKQTVTDRLPYQFWTVRLVSVVLCVCPNTIALNQLMGQAKCTDTFLDHLSWTTRTVMRSLPHHKSCASVWLPVRQWLSVHFFIISWPRVGHVDSPNHPSKCAVVHQQALLFASCW